MNVRNNMNKMAVDIYLDNFSGFNKCDSVFVVFCQASRYCQYVRVKDNVVSVEADFFHQDFVGPGADFYFPITIHCL